MEQGQQGERTIGGHGGKMMSKGHGQPMQNKMMNMRNRREAEETPGIKKL
jgi:hypothetical protein